MISILFSRLCILTCGTLFPGYISFKTVRAKNIDDYVKWMMYWIVFAIFTSIEAFSDIFLTWFPFYYEFKIIFILWLLPTMGNGSAFLYKLCIHPLLKEHETRIDYHLSQISKNGQALVLQYVKDAVLCIVRNIMDAVNKNFPNGVLGLLPQNNLPSRSVENSQSIIIMEAIENQQISKKLKNQRKGSTSISRNKESDVAQTIQSRGRRTRHSKQEINHNLNNES